ncbi:hypothetical protein JTB14_020686 [Gonioctena quinquepunctata]|nr:hypothetical protein JTB14_020686 [Gonioctena quinquepunctata]
MKVNIGTVFWITILTVILLSGELAAADDKPAAATTKAPGPAPAPDGGMTTMPAEGGTTKKAGSAALSHFIFEFSMIQFLIMLVPSVTIMLLAKNA